MTFLYGKQDRLDLRPDQAQNKPLGGFVENLSMAYQASRATDQSQSNGVMLGDQWQPIIDEVNEVTGSNFFNPANHLSSGILSAPATPGHNEERYKYTSNKILEHIAANADLLPDLQGITHDMLVEQAKQQAKDSQESFLELSNRSPGFSNTLARFAGSMGGIATDPVVYESLGFGGVSKTLYGAMFREAAIGAGVEAIAQAGVKEWYNELGYDYDYADFWQAVAFGGVFGGAAPLAFRVGGKTVTMTADQAKRGYRALVNSGAAPQTPIARTAETVAEGADEAAAANPFSESADLFPQREHESRILDADRAIENAEAPTIPDEPTALVQPPKSVYEADNLDGLIFRFDPDDVGVDAETFQFKAGGDEFGVTDRLQGITTWDPIKAGQISVYEFADGRKFIDDGHQRLGLAKRIKAQDPSQDVQLYGHLLREVDGITPEMARVIAAVKNIAEGTGTAIDAAKVLRDAPARFGELPPKSALVRQAQGLVQLSDEAFGVVINGVVPANYAALVGRLIPEDEGLQSNALSVLSKTDPANEFQAEAIVRQVRDAGSEQVTQIGLFGEEVITESFFAERAKVLDRAQKALRQDKNAFRSLVQNAERLETEGNQLAKQANQKRADNDAQAIALLQALANRKGELSDALTAAARQARETGSYTDPTRNFVDAIRRSVESGDFNRLSTGDVGQPIDVAAKSRQAAKEPEPAVDDFDEPGGIGAQRQAEQLEQDNLPPRREGMQEDELLRDDLRQLLERGADEAEIDAHPAVTKAIEDSKAIPETQFADGYLTEQWIQNRQFKFGEETVTGYIEAVQRLYVGASRLAWGDKPVPPNPTRMERQATIVLGPPAAGKSTIADPIARKQGAIIVDPDEAKKVLPEYAGGIGASAVHEESSYLANLIEQIAMAKGANVVLPKVGGNVDSLKRLNTRLKDAGYEIDIVDMKVSYGEARRRMFMRFVDTGRLIDPDYVRGVGEKPSQNYDILKQEGVADGYARIDNNGPRDAEKPLLEDTRNLLEGTDLRLSEGRGESGELGARATSEEISQPSPEDDELMGFLRDVNASLAAREEELQIPVAERVNEEGEVIAETMTLRDIRNELDQDQKMLDRLEGCVT